MKYAVALLALAAGALADLKKPYDMDYHHKNGTIYTTITTTALTTYCPEPTKITHNGKTYTVTAATTLTITDCPCTITQPVHPTLKPTTVYYTSCPPTDTQPPRSDKTIHVDTKTYIQPLTVVTSGAASTATREAYTSKPAEFVGAASANQVSGLLAMMGLAALAL